MIRHNLLFAVAAIFLVGVNSFPKNDQSNQNLFRLSSEPNVRIGLIKNASSASITTSETSLVLEIDGDTQRFLNTKSVRASSRPYDPPKYEVFHFEITGIESIEEANALAIKVREHGNTRTLVQAEPGAETFRIRLETEKDFRHDAENYVADLALKGIENVSIYTDEYTSPSDDAIALSTQIARLPKSNIRSLLKSEDSKLPLENKSPRSDPSRPVWIENRDILTLPNLREAQISGASEGTIRSLKPIVIGTSNADGIIRLNGKRYRGKMEILVNSKGRITVVNVVPMEDYLLGVVPAELSLPELEAQKAQAIAARTYGVANKDGYKNDGYDMLPTVWSQVYKGVQIETKMGTRAVKETAGIVATHKNTPINALYTSTCGGRTENSGNIFEFDEPYLKGVECSLPGMKHFDPFLVKTNREPASVKNDANFALVRTASIMAVHNFVFVTKSFDDNYFESVPTEVELRSWMNQLAVKFEKPFPTVNADSSKPLNLARILYSFIYDSDEENEADTLLSDSDIEYQLSFRDADEIPKEDRLMLAELMRDGWFSLYPDMTIKPGKRYSRAKIIKLVNEIFERKKWDFDFENGITKPTYDGTLNVKFDRGEKALKLTTNAFIFRKYGDDYYEVNETPLIGGEKIRFKLNPAGDVIYLEIEPSDEATVAEKMSPFTNWNSRLSPNTVRARLARYVKGMGSLYDIRIAKKGYSRRAIELEIVTSKGVQRLEGGKIRSALRLKEQLFAIDKKYGSNGRVTSYRFKGRGWGHGVGMCQYGAYGFAKMGLKYDQIVKHYYTGVHLTKAY